MGNKKLNNIKRFVKAVVPPIFIILLDKVKKYFADRGKTEFEYIPEGWSYVAKPGAMDGWNEKSILEVYKKEWPKYLSMTSSTAPLYSNPAAPYSSDINTRVKGHNVIMSFAYSVLTAAGGKKSLSLFDWGGGIGFYSLFAKAILPGVDIQYSCRDMDVFVKHANENTPNALFYSDDSWIKNKYDFVMASASVQYKTEWKELLRDLVSVASGYVYIAQLPVVPKEKSFVFIQRPYKYGYNTEYLGWCLNKKEFLSCAKDLGLELVREFTYGYELPILNAPEQNEYSGFLFFKKGTA
ncbi:MAG TPA: hypothetical protein PKY78_00280 [Candidatus Omnitrophota bacterium]|nr:hypothetical protein [Candidatus Omnitrophota bacterium]HPS19412.1 hypothetical protein [Candidatus Omnitrophota bacterium]